MEYFHGLNYYIHQGADTSLTGFIEIFIKTKQR